MIDPTYLRFLYDGLDKNTINKENQSALPEGLVGIYEEAFNSSIPLLVRQKSLNRFAVFALLKKEVSVHFVAEISHENEEDILDHISKYSKWFNSLESNKYQTYHERLKVYFIQKLSEKELRKLHQNLIARLKQAIKEQKKDEFELYALEFLSQHLMVEAFYENDGKLLLDFVQNKNNWERQIEISNAYNWSKTGLQIGINYAIKNDHEEVVNCGLGLVELNNLEQNDATAILKMVAENKIDLVLVRITAFGGPTKEEKQRQFILIMLCLMELTLLESKNKPYSGPACKLLLDLLEEEIQIDHSLLNWRDFFSSYLMFLIAVELHLLEIDIICLCKRTNVFKTDWVSEKGPYTPIQFDVLDLFIQQITDNLDKNKSLYATELSKQGQLEEALIVVNGIINDYLKQENFREISIKLINQGKIDEALTIANKIQGYYKVLAFIDIVTELVRQGKVEQALITTDKITHDREKDEAFEAISIELVRQGKVEQALLIADRISDDNYKSFAFKDITTELVRQDQINQALSIATGMTDDYKMNADCSKRTVFIAFATELAKKGQIDHALSIITDEITEDKYIRIACNGLFTEFVNNVEIDQALSFAISLQDNIYKNELFTVISNELSSQSIIDQAISVANEIVDDDCKSKALTYISNELAKQGEVEQAMRIASEITNDYGRKAKAFVFITMELAKQGHIEQALSIGIADDFDKNDAIFLFCSELVNQGEINHALIVAKGISDGYYKNKSFTTISNELAIQGQIEQALNVANEMTDDRCKNEAFMFVFNKLTKDEFIKYVNVTMQNSLSFSKGLTDDYKMEAFANFSLKLIERGQIDQALKIADVITDDFYRIQIHLSLFANFLKQKLLKKAIGEMQLVLSIADGMTDDYDRLQVYLDVYAKFFMYQQLEKANTAMKRAMSFTQGITDDSDKIAAYISISAELAIQEQLEQANVTILKAMSVAQGITNDYDKSVAFVAISVELAIQEQLEQANTAMNQAMSIAKEITEDIEKCQAFISIYLELSKQGQIEQSNSFIRLALSIAKEIIHDGDKNRAFVNISIELAKQGKYKSSFDIIQGIEAGSIRMGFWQELGSSEYQEKGLTFCVSQIKILPNDEASLFYKKGIVLAVNAVAASEDSVLMLLHQVMNDSDCVAHLMQMHALHILFFTNPTKEKVQHFNQILNTQWAIDIKDQLSN